MSQGCGYDLFIHVMNHSSPRFIIAMRFNNYPWHTILREMYALINEFGFRDKHLISTSRITYFLGDENMSYGKMIADTVNFHVLHFGIAD